MARNTKHFTIQEEAKPNYRDNGKTFLLTEMPADQGARWADRFIFAIMNAGIDLPDGIVGGGMAGLAAIGLESILKALSKVPFEVAEPLLDEIMTCVQWRGAAALPWQAILSGINCQIEEVQTFYSLRIAWLELHLGFSFAAALQKLRAAQAAELSSQSTPTSLDSSAPS